MARNPYYQGPVTDHFDGTRFHLPGEVIADTDKSFADLWRFSRTPGAVWPPRVALGDVALPVERVNGAALRVTSLGHAGHLIQTQGLNLLVDPVWSDRASPTSFAGPKRVVPPPFPLAALPPLDAILISHNHYDHLDLATLDALQAKAPCRIIVPLGNDTILRRHNKALTAESYDWGERVALSPEVSVTLLPSRHWSARGPRDRRMALWAAFMFVTPAGSIYHIGDTSFGDGALFRDAFERFGRPRLAVLPIGAYEPRWFMKSQHVDPDEAVGIFEACQAHYALAHHWGCFRLTTEPYDEPPRRLAAALASAGIAADRFRVQQPGEAFDVPELRAEPL